MALILPTKAIAPSLSLSAVMVAIAFAGIQHKTIQVHPLRVERSSWFFCHAMPDVARRSFAGLQGATTTASQLSLVISGCSSVFTVTDPDRSLAERSSRAQ